MTHEETTARLQLLEEIADGVVDMLDGEPSGSDSLDWALRRYGYHPTKGVAVPLEERAAAPRRLPVIPAQLVQAYFDDPTIHAVFQLAAQRGADEVETLTLLVLELVKEKKRIVDAYTEHMLLCSLPRPTI